MREIYFLMCFLVNSLTVLTASNKNFCFCIKQHNCMSQRPKTPKNTILPLTIHTKVSETVDQAKTLDVNRA